MANKLKVYTKEDPSVAIKYWTDGAQALAGTQLGDYSKLNMWWPD